MNLLIVESPNKCKKIQSYLGAGWVVKASMGHVRDLPKKEMGVDLDTFKPKYVPNDRGRKTLAMLKKACASASEVYLATDPDREGEAIAWHLQQALGLHQPKRVAFHEITRKAVNHAISQPGCIDYNRVRAQEGRRVLDRLVGYSVSPALSNIYGRWLTAGRVQSPAVLIVVEREIAIQAFKSSAYVEVFLTFENDNITWTAQWNPAALMSDEQKHWTDVAFAQRVAAITELDVVSIQKKKLSKRPPAPFTTSSLQQGASVALRLSPKKCMQLAQQLFEDGLITYHRTDSPNLSDDGFNDITAWLVNNDYADHAVKECNTWKAPEGAQEGHEAIRPTLADQTPDILKSRLTDEQSKLYKLIWERAVASQMKNAEFNLTVIHLATTEQLDNKTLAFVARGQQVTYQGWMLLSRQDATHEGSQENNQQLPALSEGQHLNAVNGEVKHKKTKPPARYTEASLVKKLEAEGIGRPSTYASIIDNIIHRGYVSIVKRKLQAEKPGFVIYEALVNRFAFMSLSYTRDIEKQLDDIACGKNKYENVVRQAYTTLSDELKSLDGVTITPPEDQPLCPQCNKPLRLIQNKFWGCTGFKKDGSGCRYTAPDENGVPGKPLADTAINKQYPCACGNGTMQRRSGRSGMFWGCSSYPACKNTLPDNNGEPGVYASTPQKKNNQDGAGQSCPDCDKGQLIRRTVKNGKNAGKNFLGCSNYPACKHFEWTKNNA